MTDDKDTEASKLHTTPMGKLETSKGSEDPIDDRVYTGVVAWFGGKQNNMGKNKSYGFIEWFDNGVQQRDMFVHFSNIITENNEFKTLKKGQKVSFQVGQNFHLEPKAVNVKVIPD